MKFFTNKKFLFKLIAALCICLTIINFGLTPSVQAETLVTKVGGKLLDPVCALIVALGDGMMEILQKLIMGTSATALFDNTNEVWWKIVVAAVIAAIVIIVATIATQGAALGFILAKIGPLVLKIGAAVIIDGLLTGGAVTGVATTLITSFTAEYLGDTVVFPTFTIGPQEIFSGEILLFDPNIFNPKELKTKEQTDADGNTVTIYYYEEDGKEIETSTSNAAQDLKDVIARWYYIIRNIAIVGLMLVLLYVGIKMLLTSIASDKAKYKQMLSDWLVALCLVFLMQYIMVFANSFVEGITKIFSSVASENMEFVTIDNAEKKLRDGVKKLEDADTKYVYETDENGNTVNRIVWPTNMMGKIRFATQQQDGTSAYIGYSICYFVLVLFTIFFSFTYLKRLLYLLFLTIIAPLVALTYPLDKLRDGQAQAFNTWVKEYFINLIIQPFHLLLYIVFISMAYELAGKNIIYSLVVIGFMIPAEKFLRNMFGFNKASTPGFLGGAAGAAMAISAVQSLGKFANKGSGGKNPGKGGSSSSENNESNRIRSADSGNTLQSLMEATASSGGGGGAGSSDSPTPPEGPTTPIDSGDAGKSAQERMLDQYDEGFGTDDYDPTEREAMARELNSGNEDSIYDGMSDDEKIRQLMESTGYSQEEAASLLGINMGDSNTADTDDNPIGLDNTPRPQQSRTIPQAQTDQRKTQGFVRRNAGYLKARGQNFAARNLNAKKIKGVAASGARMATKFTLGATAAGIGIAAGIASGSPGDVFKYGVAGAYAGSSVGQGIANRVGNSVERERQLNEETLKRQYGEDEYERMKNKKLDDEFKKDKEMRKLYSMNFNNAKGKDLDKIMDAAIKYRQYGITDNTTIMRAMALNPNDMTDVNSMAAAKMAQFAKSEKDLEAMKKRYAKIEKDATKQQKMEDRIRQINKETLN